MRYGQNMRKHLQFRKRASALRPISAKGLAAVCAAALLGCAAPKPAGNETIVTEGASAADNQHVVDGSGKAVSDSAQECVSTGHSGAGGAHAEDCGESSSGGATNNAPAPVIAEPVAPAPKPEPAPSTPPPAAAQTPASAPPLEITRGEVVNAAPVKLEEFSLQADALFKFGKSAAADLLPAGRQRLDELAARIGQLGADAVTKITITGHADRLGLDALNQVLSRQRAESVQQYLASKGVPAGLLQASARGETQPVVHCKGEKPTPKLKACLAPNRRVEVVVYGQK
jgi:outer membrane protein OmpA-like peptidoglycan-associated protein